MAYIPPHKRHSKDSDGPSLTPALFLPPTSQNPRRNSKPKILYASDSISRWFIVSEDDAQLLPCSIRLKEFSCESVQRKYGGKPIILVREDHQYKDVHDIINSFEKTPWVSTVAKIQQDLLTSFQNARNVMCSEGTEPKVPHVVFRFGKVLFHGIPSSTSLENIERSSVLETALRRSRTTYHTNVPKSYVDTILSEVIQKIGVELDEDAEYYHVKVIDKTRPHTSITCKCSVIEAVGELEIYKIELNEMRHLVVDISCLDKNIDVRMMLSSKRILTSLTDNEKHSLGDLLKSAVIDSEVKGGLRWPLGEKSLDDKYVVVGFLHSTVKIFKNPFMRLKIRCADRFDVSTSIGEVTREVSLRMTELNRSLMDTSLELNPLTDMVRDTLKLVWDHFLGWEGSFA